MANALLRGTEVVLPQLPIGWHLVTAAVLIDGRLGLLASNVDLANEWRRDATGLVLGDPWKMAARAEGRLWCFDGKTLTDGPALRLETPSPRIDRFDDGCWLIVARRTEGKPNGRILGPDGHLLTRIMLGDGIEHVGVDRFGQIWVGWFDEGVFGNFGWRVPNEEWPPSGQGIGLFSSDGDYRPLPDFPEYDGNIADCYALNVADDGAWACPYTDFPFFHLRPDRPVRWWTNELSGARALAVSRGHVLLAGGYVWEANRLALVALDGEGNGEAARTVATLTLPLLPHLPQPNESPEVARSHPWQHPTLLAGRGDTIHLIQGGTWHRWRVADALAAVVTAASQ